MLLLMQTPDCLLVQELKEEILNEAEPLTDSALETLDDSELQLLFVLQARPSGLVELWLQETSLLHVLQLGLF